ncbi:MAG: hypothetical protein C0501_01115 [Isosphaera sp.]|nr:hypothetical protein [Isosphaera sp.]
MPRTAALVALTLLAGCSRPTPEPPVVVVAPADDTVPAPRPVPARAPAAALAAGVEYLLAHQADDGSWRSDRYATFKDGTALTPFAVCALQDALDAGVDNPEVPKAVRKGCDFLMQFLKAPGVDPGPDGFEYPLYTAALTLKAFSHPSAREFSSARGPWVKFLKERQLTEALGWKPDEKPYGGWGYCRVVPRKPAAGAIAPPLVESNLSATAFALDALRAARELDADTAKAAAVFVRRCQNADGGFHFVYDDPVRNKAGKAGDEPLTFHSYGSTTADGLRALVHCSADGSRAVAWLAKHFRADTHPGVYVERHEPNREAVYYYYAASAARGFRDTGLSLPGGRSWAAELAGELAGRQWRDGRWENRVELVRENEPLVATCFAVSALAACDPSRK